MDPHAPLIYLDNAATTFPKPPQVLEEMFENYARMGASPGRGGYDLAVQCEHYVQGVRQQISDFFGGDKPEHVAFAYNSTDALNTIILGLIEPGCHVVSSRLEHNSVLRPLHHLRDMGLITFDLVPFDENGFINPQDVADLIKPATRFVILNHVSNVLGTIQPVSEVGGVCRDRGIPLVIDASQSAGLVPIDMRAMHVDALAFTGHKSLMGPTGIGGLILREGIHIRATRFGGTGLESQKLVHPEAYPYRLEAGTINVMGIIGLSAGLRFIAQRGMANIYNHEMSLAQTLRDGLAAFGRVKTYCADSMEKHIAVLTCNAEGIDPEDFAAIMDGDFNIATRSGLHCAPLVHQDIGTSPSGGVRFSFGPFNTAQDVSATLSAVAAIAK
jgi:cysteine desulfurase family protein